MSTPKQQSNKWILPVILAILGAIFADHNKDTPIIWVGIIGGIILGVVINFIIDVVKSFK